MLLKRTAALILHPLRMRIIGVLAGGRRMTVQALAEVLPDSAPATLYRHLNTLRAAGVISVVEERRVRGAIERVYALSNSSVTISPEDLSHATPEEHLRFFAMFLAGLLDEFGRYVSHEPFDFARDGAGYRQVTVYLNDDEMADLAARLAEVIVPLMNNGPASGRRLRTLTSILIPGLHETRIEG